MDEKHRYRYAEQLRSAALSISNNIAEVSGSSSINEFRNFLNFARRSTFECANMLLMFRRQKLVTNEHLPEPLFEPNHTNRMLTAMSRTFGK